MDAIFDTGHLQSGLGFFFVRFSRILDKFTDRIYIYKYRCSEVKQILISVFNIFHNDSLRGREVWLFSFLPHFFSAEGSISRCFASSFVYACSFLKINLWDSLYGGSFYSVILFHPVDAIDQFRKGHVHGDCG